MGHETKQRMWHRNIQRRIVQRMGISTFVIMTLVLGICGYSSRHSFASDLDSWESCCGSVCLRVAIDLLGGDTSLAETRRALMTNKCGITTLEEIRLTARQLGYDAVGVKIQEDEIEEFPYPIIAYQEPNHFVVIVGLGSGQGAVILDPPRKPRSIHSSDLQTERSWRGLALSHSLINGIPKTSGAPSMAVGAILMGLGVMGTIITLARKRIQGSTPRVSCSDEQKATSERPAFTLKWTFLLSALLLITVIGLALFLRSPQGDRGSVSTKGSVRSVSLDEGTWLFGRVRQGEELTHSVRLTNQADSPVKLRVKSSCPCLSARVFPEEVDGGAQAVVNLSLDTKDRSGFTRFNVFIEAQKTSEQSEVLEYAVRGEVQKPEKVSAIPHIVDFGNVLVGTSQVREVIIKRSGYGPLALSSVKSSLPFVQTRMLPSTLPDASEGAIQVSVSQDAPLGGFECELEVETNHPTYPNAGITVRGQVVGDLAISPEKVFLGQASASHTSDRRVVVRSRRGIPFRIMAVSTDTPDLLASAEAVNQERTEWHVNLNPRSGSEVSLLRGELTLETDCLESPTIQISFLGATLGGNLD